MRRIWLLLMAVTIFGTAASNPRPTGAQESGGCLMDGSICYSPAECCSERCKVQNRGAKSGRCDPHPDDPGGEDEPTS